jgi:hypothetical protein
MDGTKLRVVLAVLIRDGLCILNGWNKVTGITFSPHHGQLKWLEQNYGSCLKFSSWTVKMARTKLRIILAVLIMDS